MFSTTWNNRDWIYSPALEHLEKNIYVYDNCFQTLNYRQCMKGNKLSEPYNCPSLSPGGSFQAVVQKGGTQLKPSILTGMKETKIGIQEDQDL